jgi:hypothetical protein
LIEWFFPLTIEVESADKNGQCVLIENLRTNYGWDFTIGFVTDPTSKREFKSKLYFKNLWYYFVELFKTVKLE